MSEWQPIESSPKDGSDYLVYCEDTKEQFVCCWHNDGHVYASARGIVFKCLPSQWRMLPEPPNRCVCCGTINNLSWHGDWYGYRCQSYNCMVL